MTARAECLDALSCLLLTATVTHVLRRVVLVHKLQVDSTIIECSGCFTVQTMSCVCCSMRDQGCNKSGVESGGVHCAPHEGWGYPDEQLPVQCSPGAAGDASSHTVLCSSFRAVCKQLCHSEDLGRTGEALRCYNVT